MRIASSTLYQNNLDTMANQQNTLVDLQNQISSGKRVSSAADDPEAAAQTVRVTQASAKLGQYAGNLSTAKSALQLEDNTLAGVTTLLQQAQSIGVSAGNATLDPTTRTALATELESVRDQLYSAANATDSQGNYLFGGYQTGSAPFTSDSKGNGVYQGSLGERRLQVSDVRQMTIGEVGSRIFQGVTPSASRVASAALNNAGSATATPPSTVDAEDPAFDHDFSLHFAKAQDGALHFSVHDNTANTDVVKDQPYVSGANIKFAGQSVALSGEPATGDSFDVKSAQTAGTDIFGTLTQLAKSIRSATPGTEGNARITNAINTANVKLANALDNVLTVQATVGAREQEADTLSTQNTDTHLQYQSQLSDLTSADFASTYSKFSETQNSLQAAEKTFMQMQNLSLFDLVK